VTRALAEVGRPGPARDVLEGGDVDPTTGRLLSVGELQVALRAARLASTSQAGSDKSSALSTWTTRPADATTHPGPADGERLAAAASSPITFATSVPAAAPLAAQTSGAGTSVHGTPAPLGVLRPPAGRHWVAVVGAHRGAGTSTVALALADAAAAAGWPVHLVSCNPPAECGLVGAATVELGTDPAGSWRTGRRGAGITVDRPAAPPGLPTRDATDSGCRPSWPPVPLGIDDGNLLTIVDAEAGAARTPHLLATAAAVLLACRVSVPGVQQAEQLLGSLLGPSRSDAAQDALAPVVLLAALGDAGWSGRWPRAVRSASGPLLRQLQSDSRVLRVPLDRHLSTYRPTGSALPRAVTRSAALAVRLLDSTRALSRPGSTGPDLHAGTSPRTPAPSAPNFLLDDKDTG